VILHVNRTCKFDPLYFHRSDLVSNSITCAMSWLREMKMDFYSEILKMKFCFVILYDLFTKSIK